MYVEPLKGFQGDNAVSETICEETMLAYWEKIMLGLSPIRHVYVKFLYTQAGFFSLCANQCLSE